MNIRLIAAALALWPGVAAAEGCLDQVQALAKAQNISTDPPTASPDKAPGVTSRELGRSGGVIEPPATSDRSVVTPPPSADSRMPTLPDVTEKPGGRRRKERRYRRCWSRRAPKPSVARRPIASTR